MIVGSNERLYGWQDEGFNTFIDYFSTVDRFRNDTAALNNPEMGFELGKMSAWLAFLRSYNGRESPSLEPQDRNPGGMLGGWLNYGKPAAGLHFLRNEVVDSTQFDYAFREYTRRWAFKHPTPADFFRSMNDALGEDLSWFWRSWFYRTDHLDQAVDSVQQRDSSGTTITRIFLSNKRGDGGAGGPDDHARRRHVGADEVPGGAVVPGDDVRLPGAEPRRGAAGAHRPRRAQRLPRREPRQQHLDGTGADDAVAFSGQPSAVSRQRAHS